MEKVCELIKELKRIKTEKGYSLPQIMDMIEEQGSYISMTTLRRVFAEGSETVGFRYDDTIQPIASALLDFDGEDDSDAVDALKNIIKIKNDEIAILHGQITKMQEDTRIRIDFLKKQIELKDQRMDEKDKIIDKLLKEVLSRKGE